MVDVTNDALAELKETKGITSELASCHTAEIGGYVIEGHVPAEAIEKLLDEKPDVLGLVVPGMPQGSPGMSGELQGPLEVFAYDQQGEVWIYTTWQ